jgi:hypothetical protein
MFSQLRERWVKESSEIPPERVAQGPRSGPAALPAVRAFAAPPQDNPSFHGSSLEPSHPKTFPYPRRQMHGAVEKPQGWRASLALHFLDMLWRRCLWP